MKHAQKNMRRPKGMGTIWQNKNGIWRGQVSVGSQESGTAKKHSFSGQTREEVEAKLEAQYALQQRPATESAPTLDKFIRQWLLEYKRIEICSKSYEWYLYLINHLITPFIGGTPLGKVNTLMVQGLINKLSLQDKYSDRTVRGVRGCLMQAYDLAIQMGIVETNPATSVKLPRQRAAKRKKDGRNEAISATLRTKLLKAAEAEAEPLMKTVVTLLMFTGLRIGELLALKWEDVNVEKSTLDVDEAIVRRPVYNAQGDLKKMQNQVDELKTSGSYRTIKVPQQVMEVLTQWRQHLAAKPYGSRSLKANMYVFRSSATGSHYTYTGFRSSYYKFLGRHGLDKENLHLHRYRHTYATMLLESKVNPKVVQSLLGHASITTTLGIYSHVTRELYDDVAQSLDGIYSDMQLEMPEK